MFKVVDNHGANSSFDEILVLKALSLFQFETQYDFICLQECDGALLDLFEPSQHRVHFSREYHSLLCHELTSMGHDSVIDD